MTKVPSDHRAPEELAPGVGPFKSNTLDDDDDDDDDSFCEDLPSE